MRVFSVQVPPSEDKVEADHHGGTTLDRLMPLFLWADHQGIVRHAGPTMRRLCADQPLIGAPFWDVFESPRRPQQEAADLPALHGLTLHLRLRRRPDTVLRALLQPAMWCDTGMGPTLAVPDPSRDAAAQGSLANFSFGIDLADAVLRHGLTSADFAPTDLALELLYLHEAKTVVMHELQALNTRLEDARQTAEAQALADPLTGLTNRRGLELALSAAISSMAAGGPPFALAHIDLDRFKQVNDTEGHAAGDRVLIRVAQILREGVRRSDLAARVGGDEFILLLRDLTDVATLRDFGARLIAGIERPIRLDEGGGEPKSVTISASIGIAIPSARHPPDLDRLMSMADGALYASKRRGRARCTIRQMTAEG
ncbi:diguanylate cyclase domain-containing protein [Paracoccus sp. p3-h83]